MFALVEGPSNEHKKLRHVLTAYEDMLLIYQVAKEQFLMSEVPLVRHEEAPLAAAPVASFKAPNTVTAVQCHGAAICVACEGGAVCILSAPFLAV